MGLPGRDFLLLSNMLERAGACSCRRYIQNTLRPRFFHIKDGRRQWVTPRKVTGTFAVSREVIWAGTSKPFCLFPGYAYHVKRANRLIRPCGIAMTIVTQGPVRPN